MKPIISFCLLILVLCMPCCLQAKDNVPNTLGYIDRTGKLVIRLKYDVASDFHEGLACVLMHVTTIFWS